MKIPCDNCGKTLDRFPSRVKANKHQFCDKHCYDTWQRQERGSRDTRPCDICKTPVTRPISQFGDHVACSQECHNALMSNLRIDYWGTAKERIGTCSECGKEFVRKPSQLEQYEHSFCSKACKNIFQRGARPHRRNGDWYPCENCGEMCYRTPATLMEHVFCSPQCQRAVLPHPCLGLSIPSRAGKNAWNWTGGHEPYYGPSWYQARERARERDNHTCQKCGKTQEEMGREPDVHHKVPFRNFGIKHHKKANALSNLVCLCKSCHSAADARIP